MAIGIKKGHDQVAALLLMFLLAAALHFHPLHARPVAAPGPLPPSSHDANIIGPAASQPPPAVVAARGGGGLPKRSSSPSGCTNFGPGGGSVCPPR
uniref:Uncharacterized protein n=1 Tax=Leersia perrieri TaxID=77586 RepID=A0A0D9VY80_9ORYZ